MKSLRQQWESYRERVVPVDAPPVQVQESRRAFYAGARAMVESCVSTANDPAGEAADAAALERELEEFKDDVVEGRA